MQTLLPRLGAALAACTLLACAPALDWREVRPPDSVALALFPCKPSGQERRVQLAGKVLRLTLHACAAGGQTWGLAYADVANPALLGQAVADLRAAAAANIGAGKPLALPLRVPGATPHVGQARVHLSGLRPDGQVVQMQVALFTHGTWVFQATVLGERVPDEAAETFFSGLRLSP